MPVPPQASAAPRTTGDDQGLFIVVATFVFISISTIVVLARGISRYRYIRKLELIDFLIPITLLLAILQSVCIAFEVESGLGRHWNNLDQDQRNNFDKSQYAGEILYMLSLCIANAAFVLLIKKVEPQYPILVGCNVMLGIITTYTIAITLVLAFQCDLPTPWRGEPQHCLNRIVFHESMIIINMGIEIAIVTLPILMMIMLRNSCDKKFYVCSLFGTRIIVPLVTIPQAYYLHLILTSTDPSWSRVTLQIWSQIVLNLSVITVCLPSLGRTIWGFGQVLTEKPNRNLQDLESNVKHGRSESVGSNGQKSVRHGEKHSMETETTDDDELDLRRISRKFSNDCSIAFKLPAKPPGHRYLLSIPQKSFFNPSLSCYRQTSGQRISTPTKFLSSFRNPGNAQPMSLASLVALSYEHPRTPPPPPATRPWQQ